MHLFQSVCCMYHNAVTSSWKYPLLNDCIIPTLFQMWWAPTRAIGAAACVKACENVLRSPLSLLPDYIDRNGSGMLFSENADFWTERDSPLATSNVLSVLRTCAVQNTLPVSNQICASIYTSLLLLFIWMVCSRQEYVLVATCFSWLEIQNYFTKRLQVQNRLMASMELFEIRQMIWLK